MESFLYNYLNFIQ